MFFSLCALIAALSQAFALQLEVNLNNASTAACVRDWEINPEHLGFVHIGKCGGTSMDVWWGHTGLPKYTAYVEHADMSYLNANGISAKKTLTWLREPSARAASNILFWNTLHFSQDWASRDWSLQKIIRSTELLEHYGGAFSDGWGGTCWLGGACQNGWYVRTDPDGKDEEEVERRENLLASGTALNDAKNNLAQLAWFGIMERMDDSLELLKWQLGETDLPDFPEENKNSQRSSDDATTDDLQILRDMIPMDSALYEYGLKLFEARWAQYQIVKAAGLKASRSGCIKEVSIGDTAVAVPNPLPTRVRYELPEDPGLSDFVSKQDY